MLEKFIEMASDIKDIELHFTIGDALVFCALGCLSPAAPEAGPSANSINFKVQ